ncbi:hypothetical protein KIN20_022286 [Parelaphostrongylus tenuis]|uniref:Uncharacterized protein n=1 Tax=Parelaphostrongylus tenuis TaxID=148309 RepID=A0AAD5QS55_PARTN|nr:hypothetical protein KIN20_022286 [Parelaphostrongylus tenuis]
MLQYRRAYLRIGKDNPSLRICTVATSKSSVWPTSTDLAFYFELMAFGDKILLKAYLR